MCQASTPQASAPQASPAPAPPPWRARLDEVAQVLSEPRVPRETPPRLRAEVAAAIAEAAGPALSGAAVERLAARVSRLLAA